MRLKHNKKTCSSQTLASFAQQFPESSASPYCTCVQRASLPFMLRLYSLKNLYFFVFFSPPSKTPKLAKQELSFLGTGQLQVEFIWKCTWAKVNLKDKRGRTERLVMCPRKRGKKFHWRQNSYGDGCKDDESVISLYFINLEVNNLDWKTQLHISPWPFWNTATIQMSDPISSQMTANFKRESNPWAVSTVLNHVIPTHPCWSL